MDLRIENKKIHVKIIPKKKKSTLEDFAKFIIFFDKG